jgi:hypothetical protein
MAQANTYNSTTSRRRFLTVAADYGGVEGEDFVVGHRKKVGFGLVERLGFRAARSTFSGGSTMTRHLFFAITLIGTGVLLNSPAEAVTAFRCEDRAAQCVGRCANPVGGVFQNNCMHYCDRRVTGCMIRAYDAAGRWSAIRIRTANP